MGAEFALLLSKFAGFSRNFLDSVSSIDAYFWNIRYSFWGPISKRNTTGEDPFTSILGHEHQGSAGTSSSSGAGSYAALVLAGGSCQESVPQFEVCSLHTTLRWGRLAISEPDTTGELSSTSGGSQYEVSFLFLRSVVFCSTLDLFQHNCWNHLWHVGGGFPILDCSVTVRVLKHAHTRSSDRYASFLLAPAEA